MARPLSPSPPTVADAVIDVICTAAARNKAEFLDEALGDELTENELMVSDFECVDVPDISLEDYCKNYVSKVNYPELWLLVLITIDQLCRRVDVKINAYNAHRLVVTASCLIFKYYTDYAGVTTYVARLCGVDHDDLADMEASFLHLMDWRIGGSRSVYYTIIQQLPRIKEAVGSPAPDDVHLIPDDLLLGELLRQHLPREVTSVPPPQQDGRSPTASSPQTSVMFTPAWRAQTVCTEGVLSAHPYEVSPLMALPVDTRGLPPVDAGPSAVDLQQIKPRRVSITSTDAGSHVLHHALSGRTPSLAPSRGRSRRGHFGSVRSTLRTATSTRSPPPARSPPPGTARPSVARKPCPPQLPQSGTRPAVHFNGSPRSVSPSSPSRSTPDAAEADAQGCRPAAPTSVGCSSAGKRANIEAALSFCQNGSPLGAEDA